MNADSLVLGVFSLHGITVIQYRDALLESSVRKLVIRNRIGTTNSVKLNYKCQIKIGEPP